VTQAVLAPVVGFCPRVSLDISPPTDDRPFVYRKSAETLNVLTSLLGITVLTAGVFIVSPLTLARRRQLAPAGRLHWLAYFSLLGLGFMLIEIPVVQRVTLYLGHPTYALAVVLFSLLIFSGLGSLTTHRVLPASAAVTLRRRIPILLGLILIQGFIVPVLLAWTQGWPLFLRISVTVGLLAPLGFLMGMPFPLGWKWVSTQGSAATPWLWASTAPFVVGSVLAALVSISSAEPHCCSVCWPGLAWYHKPGQSILTRNTNRSPGVTMNSHLSLKQIARRAPCQRRACFSRPAGAGKTTVGVRGYATC
jgi:hypothetical protein